MQWVKGEAYHCTACCTAMLLGIQLKDIFNIVGHDGSELLEAPQGPIRRGHSFDEMQDVAWYYNKAFSMININPVASITKRPIYTDPTFRLQRYLSKPGILTCVVGNFLHALACDGAGQIMDPANGEVIEELHGLPVMSYYMLTTLEASR